MTSLEPSSALSLLPCQRKIYRALVLVAVLSSLNIFGTSAEAAPSGCGQLLQKTVALPGRVFREAMENVGRYKKYLKEQYGPEVLQTYGGRLIMRDAVERERPRFLRPVPTWSEIGWFRKLARTLNPAHQISQLYLGWPRDHSFHLIAGTSEWFRYHLHQLTKKVSKVIVGRPLQFTLPVALPVLFAISAYSPEALNYGVDKFGEYRAIQDIRSQAQAHESEYLNLMRTDYRYHDIAYRYASSPRGPADKLKASIEVRLRLGFFDIYFIQGSRAQHLKTEMSDEDLSNLLQLSFFKPLERFRTTGIPDVPGYRLLPSATRDPISRQKLGVLVQLVDELMMRYQVIEDWAADSPDSYRLLRFSPTFHDLTEQLDHDLFAQQLMALHQAGKLNGLQMKLAAQESAFYQVELEKCKVLGIEKIDISSGKPFDIKVKQAEILQRVSSLPDGMF